MSPFNLDFVSFDTFVSRCLFHCGRYLIFCFPYVVFKVRCGGVVGRVTSQDVCLSFLFGGLRKKFACLSFLEDFASFACSVTCGSQEPSVLPGDFVSLASSVKSDFKQA